jgi:hypothetical protein
MERTGQALQISGAPDTAAGGSVYGAAARSLGRAVQVDPMETTLKAPGSKRLTLKDYELVSIVAFNFNLRRYTSASPLEPRLTSLLARLWGAAASVLPFPTPAPRHSRAGAYTRPLLGTT